MNRKKPLCLILAFLLTATISAWMIEPVKAGSANAQLGGEESSYGDIGSDVLELKYDNGVPSDSGYGHTFDTGVGVRFTSPYPSTELTGAKFYFFPQAEGTQSNFTLRVEDAAHNTLVSFLVSYTYHNVPLPHLEGTIVYVDLKGYHIVVSGDFYIFAINHHCIFVDTSPVGSWRNYFYDGHGGYIQYGKYGEGFHDYGNLMIRAYVIAPPPTVTISTDKETYSPGDTMLINITLRNPGAAVDVVFVWLLWLPDYGYWLPIAAIPLPLPAGYEQTFISPLPIGDWGGTSFTAYWVVALLDPSSWAVIDLDYCIWTYLPTAGAYTTPEAFAEQVANAAKDNSPWRKVHIEPMSP